MIPSCQATIEKEFVEVHRFMYEEEVFVLKVKAIIETEIDGTWRRDVPYVITLLCYLTYKRQDVSSVEIYDAMVDFPALNEIVDIYYEWEEYLGEKISLSRLYEPWYISIIIKPKVTGRFWLRFDFRYSAYSIYGGKIISDELWSSKREPVYINVITTDLQTEVKNEIDDLQANISNRLNSLEAQLITIRNLMYVLTLTTIILTVITGYLTIKKSKLGHGQG
jgi:hypothetical protein